MPAVKCDKVQQVLMFLQGTVNLRQFMLRLWQLSGCNSLEGRF